MISMIKNVVKTSRQLGKNELTDSTLILEFMKQYFDKRTNLHIDLVRKYLDKIINLKDTRIDKNILEDEKINHDSSKFKDPEYEPYLHVTLKYFLKDRNQEYNPSKEIQDNMNEATFHHIATNSHHPEYWDDNISKENLNSKDRDKPGKQVDATKMPLSNVACMVADWLAMSDEKKTDPYEWAKNNVNIRWKFNTEQVKLIYDLINKIW